MSIRSRSQGKRFTGAVAILVAAVLTAGGIYLSQSSSGSTASSPETLTEAANNTPSATIPKAAAVCGKAVLHSPFNYTGKTGHYASGKAGLPTYGKPGTNFPKATNGIVLPFGTHSYQNWQLHPHTVYYMLPGVDVGNILADTGDAFVGGYSHGKGTTLTGNYSIRAAIDSNTSYGDQYGVTIEYLTIEKYVPYGSQGAVNQEANSSWTIRYDTIEDNVPGAGLIAGSGNVIQDNCLTQNGQYGFQSEDTNGYQEDSFTHGTFGVRVVGNEISYNDTCDYSGLLNNPKIGWKNYNPVPAKLRNSHCGKVVPDGDQGGFKLWTTNAVTIESNYIHDNWGPGGWADTDNMNTTWVGNTFAHNENAAIIEEISYNFSITHNTMIGNDWTDGLVNPGFPQPAIYIEESGSDSTFGGIPACKQAGCASMASYQKQSVISQNTLVNNGGGIFLWQSSNRACGDGYDVGCTLVDGGLKSPFTVTSCQKQGGTAKINLSTWAGEKTGSPSEDWWDGCMWRVQNVLVTQNVVDFNPAAIPHCNSQIWEDCGANGIFSQYGGPSTEPGWTVATDLTFFQNNLWTKNVYHGPSTFLAWNQGNGVAPVTWKEWTGPRSGGDKCTSSGERQSGDCVGPFGEDAGGTYSKTPVS
ncbi:MAG TPA: right-handed parallel beta-helix repeat-containing protein [Trebonia sp.]|jgi:hypothetical protein|nr:right-handed parallel beta-helix repeat-containing protein [Trebonia sp.]